MVKNVFRRSTCPLVTEKLSLYSLAKQKDAFPFTRAREWAVISNSSYISGGVTTLCSWSRLTLLDSFTRQFSRSFSVNTCRAYTVMLEYWIIWSIKEMAWNILKQHCNNRWELKSSSSSVSENRILTLARLIWKYICSDNTDVRGDPQDPGLSPQASQGGRGGPDESRLGQ